MSEAIVLIIAILIPAVLSLVFLWLLIAPLFGYGRGWLDGESEKKTIKQTGQYSSHSKQLGWWCRPGFVSAIEIGRQF